MDNKSIKKNKILTFTKIQMIKIMIQKNLKMMVLQIIKFNKY